MTAATVDAAVTKDCKRGLVEREYWDANLGKSASGTLDGEDTGRDADGNVGGDRQVELLEDLQHLVC